MVNLLANMSGISAQTTTLGQMKNEHLLKKDVVPVACDFDAVEPFRKGFVYCSLVYALVTALVKEVLGQPLASASRSGSSAY